MSQHRDDAVCMLVQLSSRLTLDRADWYCAFLALLTRLTVPLPCTQA